jgi:predicted porin
MKKLLLATTSLLGVGMVASPAFAADGIKLGVGGFFKEAYMAVFDDDSEGEFGNERNTDGFFNDAEVHFTGSTVLDNGLEVGARVELEGETDDDQIDEAWIWFSGGFGEVRIGSDDDALANSCIVPPGGTGNFSAFSPNQWGANAGLLFGIFGLFSSNSVCTGVDSKSDAQKIIYITPNFSGFQLTVSYTPDGAAEDHIDGAGPHVGMPTHAVLDNRHDVSAYATYSFEGEAWGLTAGLGGSWAGHAEEGGVDAHVHEQDFYQAGLNLAFGNFGIGVVGEYYNDVFSFSSEDDNLDIDTWVVGAGASYTLDAWAFGLQYSHRQDDFDGAMTPLKHFTQDRIVATANYALGPGINVDGEVGYTWVDSDPELDELNQGISDDYDAVEIGIGTNVTF